MNIGASRVHLGLAVATAERWDGIDADGIRRRLVTIGDLT